jgi:FlaA1/EpsC-like NDP-sugar epimerase
MRPEETNDRNEIEMALEDKAALIYGGGGAIGGTSPRRFAGSRNRCERQ